MIAVSPRLLTNLVYVHLSSRVFHGEQCTRDQCSGRCDWAQFHADLGAPLLPFEIAEEERARQRLKILMTGEIPA